MPIRKRKPRPEHLTSGLIPIQITRITVGGPAYPLLGYTLDLDWVAQAPYSWISPVVIKDRLYGYLAYELDETANAYRLYHNPDSEQDGAWTAAPDLLAAITDCINAYPATQCDADDAFSPPNDR